MFPMPNQVAAPAAPPVPPNVKAATLRIEKSHIALMKHPETCQYSHIMVSGKVFVDEFHPTACTNGFDTHYNHAFINKQEKPKHVTGVVLHENLHKVLKHTTRHLNQWREDPETANAAADYVVNGIIHSLQDKELAELPPGHLYAPEFDGWSFKEVYDFLRQGKPQQPPPPPPPPGGSGGQGEGEDEQDSDADGDEQDEDKDDGDEEPQDGEPEETESDPPEPGTVNVNGKEYNLKPMDGHDLSKGKSMTQEEIKAHSDAIDEALQQGGILAGRFGTKMPRQILDMLAPKVDWREVMRDFVSNAIKGNDDYTWRKLNRRYIADDYYMPTTESETVGEIINGSDTSGSITPQILTQQASELSSLCESVEPERVRQLWWDTDVHGEQVFEPGQYGDLAKLLKPMGGGGTHAGCVSDYLVDKKINAQCVIMMTDGYTEQPIKWDLTVPTLWLVTHNKHFTPPPGHKMVMMNVD